MLIGTVEIVLLVVFIPLGLFLYTALCAGLATGAFVAILSLVVGEDMRMDKFMIPLTMGYSVGCLKQKVKNQQIFQLKGVSKKT